MRTNIFYIFAMIFIFTTFSNLFSNSADTIKVYQLGDISVSGAFDKSKISQSNINTVNYFNLQNSDVQSASELQMYIPSGRIRTNSRGESMLFLRGAGERQLGLFFDGVPLNVAWDNRFDLSMLPVDIIGKIDVNKNANSIMYGPNVLGGAVNISTIERAIDGIGGNLRLQGGLAGLYQIGATNDGRIGNFNYIVSLSHTKTDGMTLSENRPDSLLNQDLNSSIRDNTDKEFTSLYARGEYKFSETAKLGISALHITGEKGVGAETHIPVQDARLWRFPDWKRTILTLNGELNLLNDGSLQLRGTFWYDMFDQKTDTYNDLNFNDISSSQLDNDKTLGSRLSLVWKLAENQNISYSINWYHTNHEEKINSDEASLFSQNIISNGISYNWLGELMNFRIGAVYDNVYTGDAGVFTKDINNSQSDYGIFAGMKYLVTDKIVLFANLSRRTRFPTMREAFSGALDRFIVNPDLKPETGILSEIGFSHEFDDFSFEIAGFANFYDGLIDQIRFTKEQDSLRRRMRVNFAKANIYGADLTFRVNPVSNLNIEGNFTYMNSSGEQDGKDLDYIDNRPEFLSGIIINYRFDFGLTIQPEFELVGKQHERSPDDQNLFVEIGTNYSINMRLAYQWILPSGIISNIFVRGNNLTDTYRLSQLGLPEQGRMIIGGISVSI